MRKFIIASHGNFSSGIKSALDIIIGRMENVFIIDAYVDGNDTIEEALRTVLANVQEKDELVVFSDLMGGSITNQVLRFALKENVHIISGMNLPLLIDIILADADTPIETVIENGISIAKEQVVYVNKLIHKENDHD
jgi:fructoselysine and glucoselysine-specific PTS system IIA component